MLHRFITDASEEVVVDHCDHNTLNNRNYNLRHTPKEDNEKHRKSKNSNNKSGYRNVCEIDGKYVVQLQIDGKNTTLKRFPKDQLEEAGRFAENMRAKYYKDFAGQS